MGILQVRHNQEKHTNFFFFNDTATTEIYTLSLHDALPISFQLAIAEEEITERNLGTLAAIGQFVYQKCHANGSGRSEEHTSELQSRSDLVCRLLLEKKKRRIPITLSLSNLESLRRLTRTQT